MTDIKNISKILIPLITFALIVLVGIAITEGFSKSLRDSTTTDGAIVVATLGAVNTSTSISTTYPFAQTLTSCISGANVTTTTSNSWCYQESANVSTACGGLDTGSYNWTGIFDAGFLATNALDGDWSSYAKRVSFVPAIYINYSKPTNALNTSLWQVADQKGVINLSIPKTCWDYNNSKLYFKINLTYVGGVSDYIHWFCLNSSGYVLLRNSSYDIYSGVNEEAMWWNITSSTTSSNSTDATNMFSFVTGDIVNEGVGTIALNDNGSALVGEELNCTITYLADTDESDAAELFITGMTVFATFMGVIVLALIGMIIISLFKNKF